MKVHNIELVEEKDSGYMFVPHGHVYVCVGKKQEVLDESPAQLGHRVLECVAVAEYHSITGRHRRTVH